MVVRKAAVRAWASQDISELEATEPSGPVHASRRGTERSSGMVTRALADRIGKAQPFPVTFQ